MNQRPVSLALAFSATLVGCDVDLGPRAQVEDRTFGQIVYREACQRVLYSEELARASTASGMGVTAPTIDVSGTRYRLFCDGKEVPEAPAPRAAPADAPPVADALEAQRLTLVNAADRAVPDALYQPLTDYLRSILPLQDDGTVRAVVQGGTTTLTRLSNNDEVVAALYRLGWRDHFRPPALAGALPRALLARPSLDRELGALLPLFSDGKSPAPARAEWRSLLRAAQAEMAGATALTRAEINDPDRSLRVATRFLLGTSPELGAAGAGKTWLAVLRDTRGLPQLATLAAPYVDADKDGLPDVDAAGHFVDKDGAALPAVGPFPPPDPRAPGQADKAAARDKDGRALTKAGGADPLYSYVNLDGTALAALLREGASFFDPQRDLPLRLADGARVLLGPRLDQSKAFESGPLPYRGFDTTKGPLLDLLHAAAQLLAYSDTGAGDGADLSRLLGGIQNLLRSGEPQLARALQATLAAFDESKRSDYAAATLPETATIYDDLAPIVARISRVPGLLPDIIEAMRDARTADLGSLFSRIAQERGYFYMNQDDFDSSKDGAVTGTPGLLVDRTRPDSDTDKNAANPANNRSVMQRLLHLVHDANGAVYCNKDNARIGLSTYNACEFDQIDDLAVFYLLTIVGRDVRDNANQYPNETKTAANFRNAIKSDFFRGLIFDNGIGDSFLESSVTGTGIPGFTRYPTPQAAARLLFMSLDNSKRAGLLKDSMDLGACAPKRPGTLCCNQNHSWSQHHDGVLFALERLYARDQNGQDKVKVTMYDALFPLVRAFALHTECTTYGPNGACNKPRTAVKILSDLMAVLHRHWPTKGSTFFGLPYEARNTPEALSSYEPLLVKLLAADRDLWAASRELLRVVATTNMPDGQPLKNGFGNLSRWLFDPAAKRLGGPLKDRAGNTQALRGDGKPAFQRTGDTVITDVLEDGLAGIQTPYYLLAGAFRKKRARLAEDPRVQARWSGAVSDMADLWLGAVTQNGTLRFKSQRVRALAIQLMDLGRERIAAHARAGDLSAWARGEAKNSLLQNLSESLSGPSVAALMDVTTQVAANEDARQALHTLVQATVDESTDALWATTAMAADTLQLLLDDVDLVPFLRGLAPAADPDGGVLDAGLALVRRGREYDGQRVLLSVLANLFQRDAGGLYPLGRISDGVTEINRPGAGTAGLLGRPLTAADYRGMLTTTAAFLSDKDRGLTRFLDIIGTRRVSP